MDRNGSELYPVADFDGISNIVPLVSITRTLLSVHMRRMCYVTCKRVFLCLLFG